MGVSIQLKQAGAVAREEEATGKGERWAAVWALGKGNKREKKEGKGEKGTSQGLIWADLGGNVCERRGCIWTVGFGEIERPK
ncbi:hypothetical protein Droror1_Dr00027778 [Drosera rotundifolia]